LYEAANRDLKPSTAGVSHVGGDYTARDFSLIRVAPRDTACANAGADLDEALSCKLIEIEP
jgi:hypothetical protein